MFCPIFGIVCLFYLKISFHSLLKNLQHQVQRGYTTIVNADNHYRKKLGAWGETFALDYLSAKGYQLLEKNFHTRYGEIDLIMRVVDQLVAVEVKTRKSMEYGIAENCITQKKYQAMQATMSVYLEKHDELGPDWQVDVLVIETIATKAPKIIHYENLYLDYLND